MPVVRFFLFDGEIGRRAWWFSIVLCVAVYLVLLGIIFGGVFGGYLWLPLVVAYLWAIFAINAKRWHSLNRSGWNSLVWFIPIFGPLYVLYHLGFQPPAAGSTSSNGEAGDTRSA